MKLRAYTLSRTLVILSLFFALMSNAQGSQGPRIHGATPKVVSDGSAKVSRHMDPAQMLRLTLTLQPVQQDDLDQFLRDVQDPHSSRFHQFLTFNEWKKRYAPSDASVGMVTGWAHRNGLKVIHQFRNNLGVKVEADAATIENAFDVKMNHYTTVSRSFYSNDRDPALPAELTGVLKNVHGLSSYALAAPASHALNAALADREPIYKPGPFVQVKPAQGMGKGQLAQRLVRDTMPQSSTQGNGSSLGSISGGISGSGIEAPDLYTSEGYDLAGLNRISQCCNPNHNAGGTPKETSIAIIGTNTIAVSDLSTFAGQYGMAFNLTQHMIDSPSCCDDEMTLDIEWSTAFANSFGSSTDTAHVHAYEGGGSHLSDLLDAWDEAHSDDNARVASSSFGSWEDNFGGIGDPSISDFTDIINAMAAEGWSIAVATGDHGATQDCQNLSVTFPASSPNVVAAGGTSLTLNNNGGKPQFASETAWNGPGCGTTDPDNAQNLGGAGGGCADTEPRGFYQEVFGPNLCGGVKRSLPDIALHATGQFWYYGNNGGWITKGGGGTSIVAPELAGFFAQVNSYLLMLGNICGPAPYNQACAPLGLPNYWLWAFGYAKASPNGRNPLYDLKASTPFNASTDCIGGQGGAGMAPPFCTADGYDQATGWGSVNMFQLAWGMANAVAHGVLPDVNFTGPTINTWYNTDKHVDFTVVSPVVSGTSASFGVAGYGAQWDNAVPDTPNPGTPGSGNSFYDGPPKLGSSDFLSLAAAGMGCHTAHVRGWDRVGYATDDDTYGPVCFDNQNPFITNCSPLNDTSWHATDVTVNCLGSDQTNGSGLANPADANIAVSTSVASGIETAFASTGSHQVCDVAGNCNTAGPFSPYKVDKKPPSITITAPTNTQYIVKQPVAANYSCSDGGSGVATCAGTVANGSNINTASVGTKTFTVNSSDNVANAGSASVNYDVTYRICLSYNPNSPISGRAANITVQICDYNGANLSQRSIVLHATAIDGNPAKLKALGNANPGNNFLFGPPSAPSATYLYVVDSQGLGSGKHVINFTVQGDPVPHSAAFTLK
jgi:Pro-kumamolisin, activation domain